jgi:hypothetical protein
VSKVPAVDQNRYHLSIANLAQFGPEIGIGKFFLFVFGQNQKSGEESLYGHVLLFIPTKSWFRKKSISRITGGYCPSKIGRTV